jgi:hypothetical protein
MKKLRGDEPSGVIIHIYMEISQGDSLCSYFYLKQAKISLFSFFFYKIRGQEGGTGPAQGRLDTNGRVEGTGKGGRKVNTVQKTYTHVCKSKNDTC